MSCWWVKRRENAHNLAIGGGGVGIFPLAGSLQRKNERGDGQKRDRPSSSHPQPLLFHVPRPCQHWKGKRKGGRVNCNAGGQKKAFLRKMVLAFLSHDRTDRGEEGRRGRP